MKDNNNNLSVEPLNEKWFKGVDPKAQDHLLSSVHSLERGQAPTPSFPLYGKTDVSVATDFIDLVRRESNLPDWLIPYEESRLEKFGPQGGHAPWEDMKENAEMYFTRCLPASYETKGFRNHDKYKKLNIQMLSVNDAMNTLKNQDKIKSRAAGWPTFDLKKTDEAAQKKAIRLCKSGKWTEGWAYFFSRFNKQKKRLFIPMPFCSMIEQARYFNPFLSEIQKDLRANKSRSPYAFWADKIGFGPCFEDIIGPKLLGYDPDHLVYVMRDFEKMDTTTGPTQKNLSFTPKLASALHFKKGSDPYKKLSEAITWSNYCPIATPDGMWLTKMGRGEASGATVTNGGETCCNEDYSELFHTILSSKLRENGVDAVLLVDVGNGDDGEDIWYLKDLGKLEIFKRLAADAANEAAEIMKFRVQGDKWDIIVGHGKYCQYLNYFDGEKMHFMYPAVLILNSIVNPEKEYKPSEWDKDYRDLDIIEKLDNGVGLPYFHKLIDYVDNGMRYGLLGKSEKETQRILSKFERYRALQDESRKFNFISEEIEADITKSPTVKYLLEKRLHSSK